MADPNTQQAIDELPGRYRGPGGAVAILKDGVLIQSKAWGYADIEKRIKFKTDTQVPICSISKQMFIALLHDLDQKPLNPDSQPGDFIQQVDAELRKMLRPELFQDDGPTIHHLCDNQSGIRDYWVSTVLWGARPEDTYSIKEHNPKVLDRLRSLHFPPGSMYSYANTNFNIVGRLIEKLTGKSLIDLLEERLFKPAAMKTAKLIPSATDQPPPVVGYEMNEKLGYIPAPNAIEWAGDAGIIASLEDMIAYEAHFDANWGKSSWWPSDATEPRPFKDGKPSQYRNGLMYSNVGNFKIVGHGGALRGWRLNRSYCPKERLSVVVLFNHESDAAGAAEFVIKKVLGIPEAPKSTVEPSPEWKGAYLDPDTQLLVEVTTGDKGTIKYTISSKTGTLKLDHPKQARGNGILANIDDQTFTLHSALSNLTLNARRIAQSAPETLKPSPPSIAGTYRNDEIDSVFHCTGEGSMMYGAFDGFMGQGPIHLMRYIGEEVWALACPRGIDAQPPGDWTLVFRRDGDKVGFTIGCALGRKLEYVQTS